MGAGSLGQVAVGPPARRARRGAWARGTVFVEAFGTRGLELVRCAERQRCAVCDQGEPGCGRQSSSPALATFGCSPSARPLPSLRSVRRRLGRNLAHSQESAINRGDLLDGVPPALVVADPASDGREQLAGHCDLFCASTAERDADVDSGMARTFGAMAGRLATTDLSVEEAGTEQFFEGGESICNPSSSTQERGGGGILGLGHFLHI